MKTRPVVIHVPVVRLPTLTQVWGVAWRLLVLLAILVTGAIVVLIWPTQEFLIGYLTGCYFAWTFSRFGWAK